MKTEVLKPDDESLIYMGTFQSVNYKNDVNNKVIVSVETANQALDQFKIENEVCSFIKAKFDEIGSKLFHSSSTPKTVECGFLFLNSIRTCSNKLFPTLSLFNENYDTL